MRRFFAHSALLFTFLFLLATTAFGQNTGTISGTVEDQSGAVVAGANVFCGPSLLQLGRQRFRNLNINPNSRRLA